MNKKEFIIFSVLLFLASFLLTRNTAYLLFSFLVAWVLFLLLVRRNKTVVVLLASLGGTLEFYYGVREDAWTGEGNGVQFRVGVSDGRSYEEYLREIVNPKDRDRDRRWLSATIDLSAYEGQLVEINFNTDPGPPRDDQDRRSDFALWGEPRVIGH